MSGKKWVLLVAGSQGWENHKHQANVCAFYQIVKKHGIPDEQIVTMMYDDIAHHPKNPQQGVIVSVLDNSNVYEGISKDYTGKDVTPENFLNALQGNSAGKKVIKSCKDDNIYVYMSGLGRGGTFEFPEKSLHVSELIEAIEKITQNGQFSKMMIFMEGSYSANVFKDHLSGKEKVFVLTSHSHDTTSTPTDYDKERDVIFSDKFSSAWLQFLNKADFTTQTFQDLINEKQAKYIKEHPGLHPCEFGKLDMTKLYLKEFLQE